MKSTRQRNSSLDYEVNTWLEDINMAIDEIYLFMPEDSETIFKYIYESSRQFLDETRLIFAEFLSIHPHGVIISALICEICGRPWYLQELLV